MNRDEIFKKLDDLNSEIYKKIMERKEFMDSVMDEVSEYHVGDEYVNVITKEQVTVRMIYRRANPPFSCYDLKQSVEDRYLNIIHAYFSNGDNTSRYGESWKNPYLKKSDYEERGEKYIEKLDIVLKGH